VTLAGHHGISGAVCGRASARGLQSGHESASNCSRVSRSQPQSATAPQAKCTATRCPRR
jgi:hypothetical protein